MKTISKEQYADRLESFQDMADKPFEFDCFVEGVFYFVAEKGNYYYELSFGVNETAGIVVYNNMRALDILREVDVSYIGFRVLERTVGIQNKTVMNYIYGQEGEKDLLSKTA